MSASTRLRFHFRAALAGAALLVAASLPAVADFQSCLAGIRVDALAKGITPETFDRQAAGLAPNDVLQFVGAQPEFTTPIWDYLAGLVDDERVADGVAKMREYPNALAVAARTYGVDPYTITAVWGVESDFGRGFGKRLVLPSLATLACAGLSRSSYFRGEMIAALRIVQEGHVRPEHFYGSWAGAFGHTQFMPTTFLRFAVDLDGDGRRDVVDSVPDALGSTANYLRQHGWVPGLPWGYEVRVPPNYRGVSGRNAKHAMSSWAAQGITRVDGKPLGEGKAALLIPAGPEGPGFLVTRNFDAIYSYNAAESYALAIAILSDRMRGLPPITTPWPNGERGLSRLDRREIQKLLTKRGYDVGDADGVLGAKSRSAIADFQEKSGQARDGRATSRVLDALRQGSGGTSLFGGN